MAWQDLRSCSGPLSFSELVGGRVFSYFFYFFLHSTFFLVVVSPPFAQFCAFVFSHRAGAGKNLFFLAASRSFFSLASVVSASFFSHFIVSFLPAALCSPSPSLLHTLPFFPPTFSENYAVLFLFESPPPSIAHVACSPFSPFPPSWILFGGLSAFPEAIVAPFYLMTPTRNVVFVFSVASPFGRWEQHPFLRSSRPSCLYLFHFFHCFVAPDLVLQTFLYAGMVFFSYVTYSKRHQSFPSHTTPYQDLKGVPSPLNNDLPVLSASPQELRCRLFFALTPSKRLPVDFLFLFYFRFQPLHSLAPLFFFFFQSSFL